MIGFKLQGYINFGLSK